MLPIGFGSVLLQTPEGLASKYEGTCAHGGQFIEFYYEEMDRAGYGEVELAEIRRLSAVHAMPVTYHLPWDAPADDLGRYGVAEGAARLRAMMARGFAIGARFMILHLGAYPEGAPRLKTLMRVRQIVEAVIPDLEAGGAVLCLENNTSLYTKDAIGVSVFEWDTLFDGLSSPHVGMCLDTGHAHVNGCLMEMTRVLAPYIRYVHLHDNDGVHDAHRAPGIGTIDWTAWYPVLAALPQRPWVMFEYPRADGFAHVIEGIRRVEAAMDSEQTRRSETP